MRIRITKRAVPIAMCLVGLTFASTAKAHPTRMSRPEAMVGLERAGYSPIECGRVAPRRFQCLGIRWTTKRAGEEIEPGVVVGTGTMQVPEELVLEVGFGGVWLRELIP